MLMTGIARIWEPHGDFNGVPKPFSNRQLRNLILPLIGEQLLVMLVGLSDTMMVSHAGEAAVSGVSLVNMMNNVFLYVFIALASGGAVVVSQYIGNKNQKEGSLAAGQLMTATSIVSLTITILVLVFRNGLLNSLFGRVESDVMEACIIYLMITTVSFPFSAIYESGAALYRSMGKTSVTMYVAIAMNLINIVGNVLGTFVFHAGIRGVAYPSLLSRIFAAVLMTALCFRKTSYISLKWRNIFSFHKSMIGRIFHIAIPNSVENGLFQLMKVALTSIIALFGTTQIAANGVANSLMFLSSTLVIAMGQAVIPVIGQCMGAGNHNSADYYTKKLLKMTYIISGVWCLAIFLATPLILRLYSLSQETSNMVIVLVGIHNLFNVMFFSEAGPMANALRAAGDVTYTMSVVIFATVVFRVGMAYIAGVWLGWGIYGVWLGMVCDWAVRAVMLGNRYRKGKWKMKEVITKA